MSKHRIKEEIEELKRQWKDDPCWDIETTRGFESHFKELFDFRQEQERIWKEHKDREIKIRMERIGISPFDAEKLYGYISLLESRITTLEEKNNN